MENIESRSRNIAGRREYDKVCKGTEAKVVQSRADKSTRDNNEQGNTIEEQTRRKVTFEGPKQGGWEDQVRTDEGKLQIQNWRIPICYGREWNRLSGASPGKTSRRH